MKALERSKRPESLAHGIAPKAKHSGAHAQVVRHTIGPKGTLWLAAAFCSPSILSITCSYSHSRFSIPRRLAHFTSAEGSHCRGALAALLHQLDLGHETALQKVCLLAPDAPLDIIGPLQADSDIITTRHTAQRPRYERHHRGVVLPFPDIVKYFSLLESVEKNSGAQPDSSK